MNAGAMYFASVWSRPGVPELKLPVCPDSDYLDYIKSEWVTHPIMKGTEAISGNTGRRFVVFKCRLDHMYWSKPKWFGITAFERYPGTWVLAVLKGTERLYTRNSIDREQVDALDNLFQNMYKWPTRHNLTAMPMPICDRIQYITVDFPTSGWFFWFFTPIILLLFSFVLGWIARLYGGLLPVGFGINNHVNQ